MYLMKVVWNSSSYRSIFLFLLNLFIKGKFFEYIKLGFTAITLLKSGNFEKKE